MKDIHSHILYGIDDGSKSIEESMLLLKEMYNSGTTDLMLTPHYVEKSDYVCNNNDKMILLNNLKEKLKEENINMNLYLGNEVFFTENMIDLIESGEVATLHNSRYVLFEFPLNSIYKNFRSVISTLISSGYTPILAHPERYKVFQRHPDFAADYVRMGVLLQGNFTSLFGKYGRGCEKLLKYYIKKGWVAFLGSDTHHEVHYTEKKLKRKLLRICRDEDYVNRLLYYNFDKVINNEEMEIKRFN